MALHSVRNFSKPSAARKPSRRCHGFRPVAEVLEDRSLMSFGPAVIYPVETFPQALVTADFNGDSRLDIAVANEASNTVSVLLGNADGSFQAARTSATGVTPVSLAEGDFNADGKLDLVTANANGNDLSVLLGDGAGGFQAPASIGLSGPASVAVGDFNGDGKLDLGATSNFYYPGSWGWYGWYPGWYVGHAHVLLGNGDGSFAGPVSGFLNYGYHTGAAVADFNGDGKDDFATVNRDYGLVSVLLGSSAGFGAANHYTTGYYAGAVAVGDFTGDGLLDIAAGGIIKGNGDGTFQWFSSESLIPYGLAPADFNGDGKLDLATADYRETINIRLGTGDGLFRPAIEVAAGGWAGAVAVGDFNGDGRPDVASANSSSNNVAALLNDGTWPALDAPLIWISDVTVTEGNSGTVAATFNVTLSAAYTQTVTVQYATANGSAIAGDDYVATSGTVTFAPGATSQPVTVLVNGDRVGEYGESFGLKLTGAVNAFIADTQGSATIVDDEPRISIDYSTTVTEGNVGTTPANFTVRLSNAYDEPVSVNFSTAEGDTDYWYWNWYYYNAPATADVDFESQSGTLTFMPGDTEMVITVPVIGDRVAEYYEVFSVNLAGATGGTIVAGHALGTIIDDEPYVYIDSVSQAEGHSGTTAFVFNLTLSAVYDTDVTVDFTTVDGSATAGVDYQAMSGTVTMPRGQTTGTITVPVNGDRAGEYDDYFYVQLTGATGAQLGGSYGYGTILDDEPKISITGVSKNEGNSGTTLFRFAVTLSGAYDQTVTVNYRTVDGTARAGTDYQAKNGTLTFNPGDTVKYIDVLVYGETSKEESEYFSIQLTGASGNALLYYEWATGYILNDDAKPGKGRGKNR
jgi:hypothetical protein